MSSIDRIEAITGCILGTAVGDAMGLPYEGMSRPRLLRRHPVIAAPGYWRGRGFISDDTEHTCLVAQALIASAGEPRQFTVEMAHQLRVWILGLPPGTGLATLKACWKLVFRISPARSGVFSAGNGPAMRSALLGVCYGTDKEQLRQLVSASTRLTHTDPEAEYGAFAVALAAHMAWCQPAADCVEYERALRASLPSEAAPLCDLVGQGVASAAEGLTVAEYAAALGLSEGVSGYVYHTVPVALYAWFRHRTDLRQAVIETVKCGGDTDSTAAIAGAVVGAGQGPQAVPAEWLTALLEWRRTVVWMEQLGQRLDLVCEDGQPRPALPLSYPGVLARNVFFTAVAIMRLAGRLLPPY